VETRTYWPDLGSPRERAIIALHLHPGDPDAAMQWLLAYRYDPEWSTLRLMRALRDAQRMLTHHTEAIEGARKDVILELQADPKHPSWPGIMREFYALGGKTTAS
jgi:hypothetical protein